MNIDFDGIGRELTQGISESLRIESCVQLMRLPPDARDFLFPKRKYDAKDSGTTIAAFTYEDGVIMVADRQTSAGYQISSSETNKIVDVSDYSIYGAAGLVSYIQEVVEKLKRLLIIFGSHIEAPIYIDGQAKLLERILKINSINTIFYYDILGFVAVPILAGWDPEYEIPRIYSYDAAGGMYDIASRTKQYTATGSGSDFAKTILDDRWQRGMSGDDAVELAVRSVTRAGERDVCTSFITSPATIRIVSKNGLGHVSEDEAMSIAHKIFYDDLRRRNDPRAQFYFDVESKADEAQNDEENDKNGGDGNG